MLGESRCTYSEYGLAEPAIAVTHKAVHDLSRVNPSGASRDINDAWAIAHNVPYFGGCSSNRRNLLMQKSTDEATSMHAQICLVQQTCVAGHLERCSHW
jgi:hypothetical protein